VGLKPGGEKSFDIRFPKDYHEPSLAGQMVTFKVKLHEVTELAKPDLDAEFVAKVSPFKTVDELKDDILQQVTSREAEAVSRQYEQQVLDKLLKDSQYKVPEPLLQQQLQRLRAELEQNLAYSGLDLPKYLELSKKTSDELDADMKPEAERRVGLAMVLTAVAEAEKLELAPGELDAEIDRLKARYNDEATRAELDGPNAREEVYNHLMASRVIAKLLSYAEKK
ncbi:MAG TPA: hypothetical protein VLF67_03460, partial [Candidatus Saccharimonas sp.]|nr:hypothetical protein [Candidatus Saccharimonas sp.]